MILLLVLYLHRNARLTIRMHPVVAKACISNQKDMVTASYISQEMAGLDDQAKHANITILNEVGLDPGNK